MSQEGTYDTDLTDRTLMEHLLTRQAGEVAARLRKHGLSGRTVTIKVRLHDFTTLSRSTTLSSPTDQARTIARLARGLLTDLDTSGGVRLLGVGVSGLADWVQEDLFGETTDGRRRRAGGAQRAPRAAPAPRRRRATLVAGDGRRARRDGPGLGLGLGTRRGHGSLRDGRDAGGAGQVVRRGRPSAAGRGLRQHPLKRREPARAVALDGPLADPQLRRGLPDAEPEPVPQHDHLALHLGQRLERVEERRPLLDGRPRARPRRRGRRAPAARVATGAATRRCCCAR